VNSTPPQGEIRPPFKAKIAVENTLSCTKSNSHEEDAGFSAAQGTHSRPSLTMVRGEHHAS